ncbi:ABC transporter ATP-binding protein [Fervidibacillus albus]|uniref:ABC transporter ATP-binding protein n=1 Tax=Fervidibacillus albus TaxID=2980026 RepID=A0A9E8LT66_9BACI|nr:ABC transporter ATP-binding protein [Fervidibacillus albus]WAA09162.1 ABC transporter ATP-binding protein [Fervidibacillus albus]
MAKVELVHVSKSYNGKDHVIKDLSVSIQPGEFFVLVGPSGCGKSTILRMIAGLETTTSGDLLINGKKANELPPSERNLSMVFQNYALYPHLTVEQNITFGLHTKKISKQEQKKRCLEAAEMLGLTDFLKYKPRQLSGGQRQRVALARAIVTHTPICLMDEPLSNLDAKLKAKMRSEIRQIQRRLGITMIYVTHDQVEAMTMADRMMILHEGRPQQIGEPLDIYNHPSNTFVASFIGAPPMNLAEAKVLESSLLFNRERTIRLHYRFPSSLERVIVGVRPEHIRPADTGDEHFIANVINVEVLGTETLVTFKLTENEQWVARWSGQWNVRVGEQVHLTIDETDFNFFHENGQRLNHFLPSYVANEEERK